jgi:hypothetical protein
MSRLLALALLAACNNGKSTTPPKGGNGDDSGLDTAPSDTDDTAPVGTSGCTDDDGPTLGGSTCVDAAPCVWTGSQGYGYFGYAISAGPDFDGDGTPDIAIGAPVTDVPDGAGGVILDAGHVTILSGATLGAENGGLAATYAGAAASEQAGTALALSPDVNGDGLADLIVGARGAIPGGLDRAGTATLVLGTPTTDDTTTLLGATTFAGESALARTGSTVAAPGDVNGDGLADLLLQGELRTVDAEGNESYGAGRAYLVLGATDLPADVSLADADARFLAEGVRDGVGLGLAGGDLDGDGYADLAIAGPYADSATGRVYLIPGSAGDIGGDRSLSESPVQLRGTSAYDAYGWSVAVGDTTGDDIADLAIGVPLADNAYPNAGRVELFAGASGVFTSYPTRLGTWTGEFDDHQLGTGLHAGPDVDGDGTGDLLMGAVSAWKGLVTKGGRTYVVRGGDSWTDATVSASTASASLLGAAVDDFLGRADAAADFDGDGAAELVIGSGYTNIEGYNDVGSVYLFRGGPFAE